VGLGVGAGGGGGKSLIVCAASEPQQKQRANTAPSSASPKCFPQFPFFIKPILMPPVVGLLLLLALVYHLNNWGMIHGL
jgi:hypothetical protein